MAPSALLFDIGNVLVRFDFTVAAQRMAKQSHASATEITQLLSPFKDDLESGAMSDAEFVRQSMERIGFKGTAEDFAAIWGEIFTENEPMTPLVKRLAASYPLYLLSNTNGIHKEHLFRSFPIFSHFRGGIYSHEARSMKPAEAIYKLAIEQFGLDPATTVYIDDLEDNIVTGARLGLVCHHYHPDRHHLLEAWLDAKA